MTGETHSRVCANTVVTRLVYIVFFRQYGAIVFMTNNRFETSKKKLAYLTFHDFIYCADSMITNWSYSSVGSYSNILS